jgi:hypothetical protein
MLSGMRTRLRSGSDDKASAACDWLPPGTTCCAAFSFDRAMPSIVIVTYPVFPEQVKQGRWWTLRATAALLVSEYVKYLAALFRPVIEWLQSPDVGRSEPARAEMR